MRTISRQDWLRRPGRITLAAGASRQTGGRAWIAAPIAVALLVALLPGCGAVPTGPIDGVCHFPGLTLVRDLVCFTVAPTVNRDGSWTWPASDQKTNALKEGGIVIWAQTAVRRVSAITRSGGNVTVRTMPVPLTQVVVNGVIPLAPPGRQHVRIDQVQPATPEPVRVPPLTTKPAKTLPPPYSPLPTSPSKVPATSPSPSRPTKPAVASARAAPAVTLVDAPGPVQWTVGGWTFSTPQLSFAPGAFSVRIRASRPLGPVLLTVGIHATLGDFTSSGALHVHHQHLTPSTMGAHGLVGQLAADWSVSGPATVPGGLPFLDVAVPLFRWPLLIGDFPLYLAVQARLHLALVFSQSVQILHGSAEIAFSGSQGLSFSEQSQVAGNGGLTPANPGLPLPSGQPFPLPKLDLAVTFPRVEIGDDFNNPVAGALAWTGFTLDTLTGSAANPGPCLRTDVSVHADAGITVWLFGLHADLSQQLYEHPLGSVSLPPSPPNPACP